MEKERSAMGKLFNWMWNFLSSLKLAIFLLIILSISCVFGTVIQQQKSPEENIRIFQNITFDIYQKFGVIDSNAPADIAKYRKRSEEVGQKIYKVFYRIGFLDLYHSWWFITLLAVFSINLLICSLKRFPHAWEFIAHPKTKLDEDFQKRFRLRFEHRSGRDQREIKELVGDAFQKYGFKPIRNEAEGEVTFFFGQKGSLSRLGIYFTHFSIIIILIGAIIGALFGYKGYLPITEGYEKNVVRLYHGKGVKVFPFSIKCEDFEVVYYEGTRRPKDYYSDLIVFENGKEVLKKRVEVNHPLIYKGVYFYQSGYGDATLGAELKILVEEKKEGGQKKIYQGAAGSNFALGNSKTKLKLLEYLPDFTMDADFRPFSKSDQPNNPAVLIEIIRNEKRTHLTWLFLNPELRSFHNIDDPDYDISFAGYDSLQYTGLQVAYDPGVWVVWLGCTLLVLGILVSFFVFHKRIWVRVEMKDGETVITIAGSANKNEIGFEGEYQEIVDAIVGSDGQV